MKALLALLTLLLFLSGCKGIITGKEYTSEEITKVADYLSVSEERLKAYKDGNISIQELGVSADRLRQAIEYIKEEDDK